jgi:hypothetical protein
MFLRLGQQPGKAVTNKEYITRTVKITNRGKPVLAETPAPL